MSVRTETFPATVMATNDDEQRGRIRVSCAGLLGDEDAELPMWVEPIPDWGWFYVPDVDEIVEIEVVTGSNLDENFGQASIDQLDIKWRGQRFYGNSEADNPTVINAAFTEVNYGKRRGFATPFGHTVMFDDTDGSQKVAMTWVQEKQAGSDTPEKLSQIILDSDGTVKLSVLGKHSIHLRENEVEIALSEGAGLLLVDKDASTTTILGDGGVKAAIADHLETFYGTLKTYIEGAIVPTAMGPSGTILAGSGPAPTWDSAINSSKLKFPDG